jgi:hypothetical protein
METKTYIAVHVKKGKLEVVGTSSYEAAKAAAMVWKLKNTSGIDVYLTNQPVTI